jgi:hypothetical protein
MAETQTIYVELLDEGTTGWRPVEAARVDGDAYKIVGDTPSDETWPFSTGGTVKCRLRKFQSGDSKLVACERQGT